MAIVVIQEFTERRAAAPLGLRAPSSMIKENVGRGLHRSLCLSNEPEPSLCLAETPRGVVIWRSVLAVGGCSGFSSQDAGCASSGSGLQGPGAGAEG